jgi:hypothetical protein
MSTWRRHQWRPRSPVGAVPVGRTADGSDSGSIRGSLMPLPSPARTAKRYSSQPDQTSPLAKSTCLLTSARHSVMSMDIMDDPRFHSRKRYHCAGRDSPTLHSRPFPESAHFDLDEQTILAVRGCDNARSFPRAGSARPSTLRGSGPDLHPLQRCRAADWQVSRSRPRAPSPAPPVAPCGRPADGHVAHPSNPLCATLAGSVRFGNSRLQLPR